MGKVKVIASLIVIVLLTTASFSYAIKDITSEDLQALNKQITDLTFKQKIIYSRLVRSRTLNEELFGQFLEYEPTKKHGRIFIRIAAAMITKELTEDMGDLDHDAVEEVIKLYEQGLPTDSVSKSTAVGAAYYNSAGRGGMVPLEFAGH